MTILPHRAAQQAARATGARSWRTAVGLAAVAGGAVMIIGAFLPWAEAFAGLIRFSGVQGANGRILLAAGIVIAAAGLYHLIRGSRSDRWLIGLAGFASLAFSGYLLLRLNATVHALGGSMALVRGGPGLWVVAAGSLAAFGTLFLPASSQATLRQRDQAAMGTVAWAADRESAGARRWVQIALGVIWLLDAALQYQPYMFSKAFVTQVLQPAGMGSPVFVSGPVMSAGQLMLHNEVAFNAVFATIQLALGVGLLWRRTARAALAGSVVWALSIWWLGEGLGGIFSGTASPVTGAPGAALLYALIAVLAWPARPGCPAQATPRPGQDTPAQAAGSVAAGSDAGGLLSRRWAALAWLGVWGSGAYFLLQASNRAPGALRAAIAGGAAGEPGWLASLNRGAATAIGTHGTAASVVLAVIFAVIAVGIFLPAAAARPVLVLAIAAAAAVWVVGESLGGILTGTGTDPNTGPLLILLAAAFWPLAGATRRSAGSRTNAGAPALVQEPAPVPEPSVLAEPSVIAERELSYPLR